MTKLVLFGWLLSLGGTALWIYGYFIVGSAPLIEWAAIAPSWIAEFLPNFQSEIGMALNFLGFAGMCWSYYSSPSQP